MSKITFIGRDMNRVTDVATALNKADNIYQVWSGYDKTAKGIKRTIHDGISVAHDGMWIFNKLRSGYTIIDIGMKSNQIRRGLWYGTEKTIIGIWKTRNIWKWLYHMGDF